MHYIRESVDQKSFSYNGITVHSVPTRSAYLKWLNAPAIWRRMKASRCDFWYCRGSLAYFPIVEVFAKRLGGKSLFWFSRDSQLDSKEYERTFSKTHARLFARIERWLFIKRLKHADFVVTQTANQKNRLNRESALDSVQIYNGHPVPLMGAQEGRRDLVLWIGRVRPFKRAELFLEVASNLKDSGYDFVVVGKVGDDKAGQQLRSLAERSPYVSLLGQKNPDEIDVLLRQARLLVCTSFVEGFPNTFIEAWMRGVPVASLEVDPDEIIQTRGLGVVESDVAELSKAIANLLRSDETWIQTSTRCRSFATGHFDIRKSVDVLERTLLPSKPIDGSAFGRGK